MSLVVLGDCATNGNNTMGFKIFQDPDLTISFSVPYHFVQGEHAIQWYLKKRKNSAQREKLNLSQLKGIAIQEFVKEFKVKHNDVNKFQDDYLRNWYLEETGLTLNDFESDQHLKTAALKHLKKKDLENSWVNLLDYNQEKVYNYAVNGNHFGNYLVRIRKHVEEYGKPDLVLITDYDADHIFTNIKYQGKRYTALMSDRYLYMEYDDNSTYPKEVYDLRRKRYIYEKSKTQDYLDRKSRRYQRLLEKYLENENINYKYILYHDHNLQFVKDKDFIDLRPICQSWRADSTGEAYLAGENSKKKFETQPDCAKIVQENIKGLL